MDIHPLLDDNRFKIGFEFEFVVHEHDTFLNPPDYLRVSGLNYDTFISSFVITKKQTEQIEYILSYGQYFSKRKNRFDYVEMDMEAKRFGIAKLIALLKLKPRNGEWYTAGYEFYDRSEEVNEALSTLDPDDYNEVKRFARRLSNYFILARYVDEQGKEEDDITKILKSIAVEFGDRLGVKIESAIYGDSLDSKNDFCLKTEYLNEAEHNEMGLEITTPPLPPREALSYARDIFDIMTEKDLPFKVKLGKDCGIHVNVSHPDVKRDQISPVYYSLMNDERALATPFKRMTQDACLPFTKNIQGIVRKLIRRGLLTLDMLHSVEGLKYVVTMIEANLDYGKFTSAYFYNIHKHGYIEYRMAGGRGYTKKYDELERHVKECLRITKSFTHDRFNDWVFAEKIKKLLVKSGAQRGKSVFPKEIFVRK